MVEAREMGSPPSESQVNVPRSAESPYMPIMIETAQVFLSPLASSIFL